jgi:diamine N-acetyltransferase
LARHSPNSAFEAVVQAGLDHGRKVGGLDKFGKAWPRMDISEMLKSGDLAIRRATTDDAGQLSRLAAQTFAQTFGAQNRPSDMELYLAKAFTPKVQAKEISDRSARLILAEYRQGSGKTLVGYTHLVESETPLLMDLSRLYLDAAWKGSGLAQLLMKEVLEDCHRRGARRLQLGVWEHNPRAIAFYRKIGFQVTGKQAFKLGEDLQTDLVMEMALNPVN